MNADRGQILPDFALGMAIFLITIAFAAIFIPQLILPFEGQERTVVSERATSSLGNDVLTGDGPPGTLDEDATTDFFGLNTADARAHLGLTDTQSINIALRNAPSTHANSSVLCAEPGEDPWLTTDCGSGTELALGDTVPDGDRDIATGRMTLTADDRTAVLEVRVW